MFEVVSENRRGSMLKSIASVYMKERLKRRPWGFLGLFEKNSFVVFFSSHGAKIAHNSKNSKLPIITKNIYSDISLQKQVLYDYF